MLSISNRKIPVKWHVQGRSQEEIALLLNCHQLSISRQMNKYKTRQTVANLQRTRKPTKLTKQTLMNLKNKLKQKNAQFSSVTTKEIDELYSIRHVEWLMHKMGFSLITPHTMHTKHDQNAVNTFREEFKNINTCYLDHEIIAIDEVSFQLQTKFV